MFLLLKLELIFLNGDLLLCRSRCVVEWLFEQQVEEARVLAVAQCYLESEAKLHDLEGRVQVLSPAFETEQKIKTKENLSSSGMECL
jgi:hypothetical protein